MAESYIKLADSSPSAATATTLYTVPASTDVVVSLITVCNRSTTPTSFRIGVDVAGSGDADAQWSYYDCPIGANETLEVCRGMTATATDLIRVYATLATLSFNLFGVKKT